MKTLKQHIDEALKIGKDLSEWSIYSCQPNNKDELIDIINKRLIKDGNKCDLNDIDVSLIKDMSLLFFKYKFNGDISKWDVSNVKNMVSMFSNTKFNQDISNWKINKNIATSGIFLNCPIKEKFKPKVLQQK